MAGKHLALSGQDKLPQAHRPLLWLGGPCRCPRSTVTSAFPEKASGDLAPAKSILVDTEWILPAFLAFGTGYTRRKYRTISMMTIPDLSFTERRVCTTLWIY